MAAITTVESSRSCPLLASLAIFENAGMDRLRAKSIALTDYLERLLKTLPRGLVDIVTPSAAEDRGCQLSLRLARSPAEAKRCHERLTAAGVVTDWREPDVVRMTPIPLYNSYTDVFAAVEALAQALRE